MSLDPDIREWLDRLAAQQLPRYWETPLDTLRADGAKLYEGLERVPVGLVEDVELDGPGGRLRIRTYRPAAGDEPRPLVVFLHGGGFVLGDIESHDPLCRRLCEETPVMVASVDYRLAPEHRYPAAADDAIFAVDWCLRHAGDIGADPARVVVMGGSAGGNLAAVAANELRASDLPPLAGQVLIYPVTDLRDGDYASRQTYAAGYGLSMADMDWFVRQYLADPSAGGQERASPMAVEDLHGAPQALIVTAEYDPLRSEGEAYAMRLEQAGVTVTYECLAGANHGVLVNPEGFAAGERARAMVVAWLRRTLSP